MKVKFNSAYIWAVGSVVALSATIMNSCSSDDDYDLYQGDELKTYAAVTRAGSESGGEDDGSYHYVYSFNCNGPRSTVATIAGAEDFYATVSFNWSDIGNAETTQFTATCTTNSPSKDILLSTGEYVERPRYVIVEQSCSDVISTIWDENRQSHLDTYITVKYKEIIYNNRGEFWGYHSVQSFTDRVTIDITDCIVRTQYHSK